MVYTEPAQILHIIMSLLVLVWPQVLFFFRGKIINYVYLPHIIEPKLKRRTALTNISQESVAEVPSVQIQTCKPCLTIWSQGEYVQHSEKAPSPFKKYAS